MPLFTPYDFVPFWNYVQEFKWKLMSELNVLTIIIETFRCHHIILCGAIR